MSLELLFPDKRYILSSNVNNLYDDGRSYSIVWQRSMIPVLFFLFLLLLILWDANRLLIGWFAASNEREKLRYAWKNQWYNKHHAAFQAQWRRNVLFYGNPRKYISIYLPSLNLVPLLIGGCQGGHLAVQTCVLLASILRIWCINWWKNVMILASYYIPLLSTYLARQTCKIESNIKQKTVPLTPPNLFIHFCRSFSIFHAQGDI